MTADPVRPSDSEIILSIKVRHHDVCSALKTLPEHLAEQRFKATRLHLK